MTAFYGCGKEIRQLLPNWNAVIPPPRSATTERPSARWARRKRARSAVGSRLSLAAAVSTVS